MKLTNPTDAELDAAFAEHVAGWMWRPERGGAWFLKSEYEDPYSWVRIMDAKGADIGISGLRFTQSADAVLPYLEKKEESGSVIDAIRVGGKWSIIIHAEYSAEDESLPRACVIALLRAHGIQVEFIA